MPESSSKLARRDWVDLYVEAFSELVEGRADREDLIVQGLALYYVNGDRPPEEIARKHFEASSAGAEELVRDPVGAYTNLAAEIGIIKRGDRLDDRLMEFAFGVAELCASVGDHYNDVEGNAGDHIRSLYGDV